MADHSEKGSEEDENTNKGNSEVSKSAKTELLGTIQKSKWHLVEMESFDQDLPQIKEVESSRKDIERYVMKGVFSVFPTTTSSKIKSILSESIQGLFKPGLAYIADNLSVISHMVKALPQPDGVILDVCLLVQDMAPAVLSLVSDDCVSLEDVKAYNLSLARSITTSVLRFTKEQFSVVYGLFTTADIETVQKFKTFLGKIREETGRWSIPSSLSMNRNKYKKIISAFVTSIALTSSVVNDDSSDTLWFLTLEQFCVLTENIGEKEVIVRTAPSTGRAVLMREVARRLEVSGPTLLVTESEEQMQVARSQRICSFMLTLEEWKEGRQLEGLTHMVTNCEGCPFVIGLVGKFWSFVPDQEGVQLKKDQVVRAKSTKKQPLKTSVQDASMVEHIRKLEFELEDHDMKILKLSEEVSALRQTEDELSLTFYSVSSGGFSLGSRQGSHTSNVFSTASASMSGTPDRVGASGGQTGNKGLLTKIKKRLGFGKTKRKESKEREVRDKDTLKLSSHVLSLLQSEDEQRRKISSSSGVGISLGSSGGSYTARALSYGTSYRQGTPGGQTRNKGLLKNIKKRLGIRNPNRKDGEEPDVRDKDILKQSEQMLWPMKNEPNLHLGDNVVVCSDKLEDFWELPT